MSVVFLNRYGPESYAPTGRLLGELVADLEHAGVDVRWSYSSDDDYITRDRTFWHRVTDDVRFYWRAYRLLRSVPSTTVVAMTDPPLLPVIAVLSGHQTIAWMQDVYPDIAVRAGVIPELLAKPIRWLMQWALRRCWKVVAIGRCMRNFLKTWHVESVVIPNWVDSRRFPYVPPTGDKRAYLGRAGVVHGYPSMPVTYLAHAAFLKACQDARIHVVSLRDDMLGLCVPSKVYTALACGRWVDWRGPVQSEARRIAYEANAITGPSSEAIREFYLHHCDRPVQTAKWVQLLRQV